MPSLTLPINPAIKYVEFENDIITIHYYRYSRKYECTKELFYKLFYSSEPMKVFNNEIKNKLKIIR